MVTVHRHQSFSSSTW